MCYNPPPKKKQQALAATMSGRRASACRRHADAHHPGLVQYATHGDTHVESAKKVAFLRNHVL